MTGPAWMDEAACKGKPIEWWFPREGHGISSYADARRVCDGCPVRAECLAFAQDNGERFGMWGGFTIKDRQRLRRPIVAATTPGPCINCGAPCPTRRDDAGRPRKYCSDTCCRSYSQTMARRRRRERRALAVAS
jgi:WhiB family redox-sensing transcriptional regulator